MSDFPEVKLKTVVNFPSKTVGRTGIDVNKEGGTYYLDLNYEKFQISPTIPAEDMPNSYNLIWDEVKQVFWKVPFALQATAGVASLGGHSGALDIGTGLNFTGEVLEANTGIVYTPPWANSQPRTLQSIFEESLSVLDFIPEEKWDAIFNYTSTDDLWQYLQAAADAAAVKGMVIKVPPGLYCSSAAIVRKSGTTKLFARGMRWHGSGMTFDTNNLNTGTIFKVLNSNVSLFTLLQDSVPGRYTEQSEFFNFTVVQSPGRVNVAAIELVAAYHVTIHRISALGGPRIALAQFRPEINPTLSDVYQCYAVDLDEVFATQCNNWPIEFSQGQSPGAYRIRRAFLTGNPGGGIYLTTGQSVLDQCNIQVNGTLGDGTGGIRFDTAEGPSQAPVIMHCEVQENQNYNFRFNRVHSLRMEGTRSISHLYETTDNSSPRWGGATAPIPSGASFTGTSSGSTTLTVTAVTGVISIGAEIHGTSVPAHTTISAQLSGTPNGAGTYTTSVATTLAGVALTQAAHVARPPVHFFLGGDITQECLNFDIKQSVVRAWESSVTAVTIFQFGSSDAINYGRVSGTDWQIQRNAPPVNNLNLFSSGFDQLPIYIEGQAPNLFNVALASSPILKCAVEATMPSSQAITGALIFTSETRDTHGAHDNATGIFTVPYAGQYKFKGQIGVPTAAGATGITFKLVNVGSGATVRESRLWITTDIPTVTASFDFTINAMASDRFQVQATLTGTGRSTVAGDNFNFLEIESMV